MFSSIYSSVFKLGVSPDDSGGRVTEAGGADVPYLQPICILSVSYLRPGCVLSIVLDLVWKLATVSHFVILVLFSSLGVS